MNVVIRLWRTSPALQIEWTGLGLLFHLCEPFAFLKRWRASVGRHGHGEALWGTCISVLRPLEISVVDIGSFINGNACILARGVLFTWDLKPPPPLPPPGCFWESLKTIQQRIALHSSCKRMMLRWAIVVNVLYACLKWSFMYVANDVFVFARGLSFPDFVDLESRMVFISLLNYVMRGIFLNFCAAPFPGSLGFLLPLYLSISTHSKEPQETHVLVSNKKFMGPWVSSYSHPVFEVTTALWAITIPLV